MELEEQEGGTADKAEKVRGRSQPDYMMAVPSPLVNMALKSSTLYVAI